jgi:hypothetical protein
MNKAHGVACSNSNRAGNIVLFSWLSSKGFSHTERRAMMTILHIVMIYRGAIMVAMARRGVSTTRDNQRAADNNT